MNILSQINCAIRAPFFTVKQEAYFIYHELKKKNKPV